VISAVQTSSILISSASRFQAESVRSQPSWTWLPVRAASRKTQALGPLTLMKELETGVWATLVLLPQTASKTNVRWDVYVEGGRKASDGELKSWKSKVVQNLPSTEESGSTSRATSFSYQCGGECHKSNEEGSEAAR
jgi:hypothetical protein